MSYLPAQTALHAVEKLCLCTPMQMDRWPLYQSSRPNQLRNCQSMVGTATWGCRGFIYQRKLPSLAGCSLSPRATTSTVDSTTSPCKICVYISSASWKCLILASSTLVTLPCLFLSSAGLPVNTVFSVLWNLCLFLFCSHIRWGAPPVINPVGSVFPNATLWRPCLSLILPVTSHSSTTFNLSNPAPGDWYVAAHLPEDDGRIEQKVCVELYTVHACYFLL